MSYTRNFFIAVFVLFWTLSGNPLSAQGILSPNVWETLPVFHNGRVMPLHTFARQTVRDICGTERPYIVWDNAIIAEFNEILDAFQKQGTATQDDSPTGFRFLNPGTEFTGGFNKRYSDFRLAEDSPQITTTLPIQGRTPLQIRKLSERIQQLLPESGRYFTADELIFAWICEPEVWTYIPIFLVQEKEYLDKIFGVSFEGDVRTSQYRVSLEQLEQSARYQQRLADMQRRYELGQMSANLDLFDQITERLEHQAQIFRELTFHPQYQRPTRMLSLLYQIVAGTSQDEASYMTAFDTWGYLLSVGEVSARQLTERATNPQDEIFLHPTTRRWHDIADKLQFLMQSYDRTDSVTGKPVFPRATLVERQFEMLIELIDTNLAESAALMESLYPNTAYHMPGEDREIDLKRLLPELGTQESPQQRAALQRLAIRYHYSVKKMRNEAEAAYLALYDNGRSLRFLPVVSSHVLEMGSFHNTLGVQPWASAQMILGSGETFVKRFFEPNLDIQLAKVPVKSVPEKPANAVDGGAIDISAPLDTTDILDRISAMEENDEPPPSDDLLAETSLDPDDLFQPFKMENGILKDLVNIGDVGTIRIRMGEMLSSFAFGSGKLYGNNDFAHRANVLLKDVRTAALRIETERKSLVDENNRQMNEHYAKTVYPLVTSKLQSEYRYDWLHPFHWMWIFALIAVVLNGAAFATSAARDSSAVTKTIAIHAAVSGRDEETEVRDYTNSIEEWLFISSVVMLFLAIGIACIGAMMRAGITGWAPVTNMYETVVMTALAAALIGMWFGLFPLLQPALRLAWNYSKFPRIGSLFELLAAMKERKSIHSSHMGDSGSIAMREAAKDFGLPGGMPLGDRLVAPVPQQDPEEFEAMQRLRVARRRIAGQCILAVPRLILTFITFYTMVSLANGDAFRELTLVEATKNMFATNDTIDSLTVAASVLLIVWIVPHVVMTLLVMPVLLFLPSWIAAELGIRSFDSKISVETTDSSVVNVQQGARPHSDMKALLLGEGHNAVHKPEDTSGTAWLKQARNAALDRKVFIAITAAIVFIVGLTASLNRIEFNPDIGPIAAVLRSNFWLTVHVIAIVVSYAAAFIAWGIAVVSLGFTVFGRYRHTVPQTAGEKPMVLLPEPCQLFSPIIECLLKIALLLLIVGTVLGARWADYSWGRFWSWDPKEVWALITILFFVIVSHGKIARYYGAIGITVGALFASIAVIVTWYGINYVFTSTSGRHTYGSGTESNATFFLTTFIAANLLWGTLALLRYNAEVYASDAAE